MSITEIPRPTTDRTQPGTVLRVTVLGVVSPFADGDALRAAVEPFGAEVDELSPHGDVARRFDIFCDERQRTEIRERLVTGDDHGHVLIEELTVEVGSPTQPAHDELAWSHLPGTLRTHLHEEAPR